MMKEIIATIQKSTSKPLSLQDIELIAWHQTLINPTIVAFTYQSSAEGNLVAKPYWCSGGDTGMLSWHLERLGIGFSKIQSAMQNFLIEGVKPFVETMTSFADGLIKADVDSGLAQIYTELGKEDNGSDQSN